MKHMKKIASFVLAAIMVLAMVVPTFAATVDNKTTHPYKAYQVFSGTQATGSSELGDIAWGSGVNSDDLLTAIKADERFALGTPAANIFASASTADDVAKILAANSSVAKAFANVAAANLASTATYIAAYGHNIAGVVLEDPPVFSTEGEGWEESFAYLDTYKPLHDWNQSEKVECWESYYLRHCYWGQLYMPDAMLRIADYAQKQHQKKPDAAVQIGFLPSSIWYVFEYVKKYDFRYGERFYDLSWNHALTHEEILSAIEVPCVYIHAKENVHENGTYLCAASREQAERAAACIGDNCLLVETEDSDHVIHTAHSAFYIEAVNSLLSK